MSIVPEYFQDVTLLITHYNRSNSLMKLLSQMEKEGCIFKAVIVSDDCSSEEHLSHVRQLQARFNFELITAEVNGGLGRNINKGQNAVKTRFTLYIQEDFVPRCGFQAHLKNAVDLLNLHPDFDMVRFYAYKLYPYLEPYKFGFSIMKFNLWYPGLDKFAYYSDHPHLRRDTFIEKFGAYKEGTSGDKTEFAMMISFLKNKGRALFFDKHKDVLDQVNSSIEPSTMKRNILRESNFFGLVALRTSYRFFKYNLSYLFSSVGHAK